MHRSRRPKREQHAELRSIRCADVPEWPRWQPSDPHDALVWLEVTIGIAGESGADLFFVAVATPRAIHGKFRGFVVDPFDAAEVEPLLRDYVSGVSGLSWPQIVEQLLEKMSWEYEDAK